MANSRAAVIALLCLFALSRAAAAPPDTDESDAAKVNAKPFAVNAETEPTAATAVALTGISFRPINRRFAVGSKHPCRHRYRIHHPRENVEIRYGNDMLIAGENGDFEIHGGNQRVTLHHHRDEDSDSDSDDDEEEEEEKHRGMKRMVIKRRYRYGRFDREKALKVLKKWKKHVGEEKRKKKDGGFFVKRVRKFLDHYF